MKIKKDIPFSKKIRAIWNHIERYKSELIVVSILGVISAAASGTVPLIIGKFFDALLKPTSIHTPVAGTIPLFIFLLALWTFLQLAGNFTDWIIGRISRRIGTDLQANYIIDAFSHLLTLPVSFFKGLDTPYEFDDKRITRVFEKGQKWVNEVNLNGVLETLSETDSFKNFGHGRRINGYDLPSMCVGHNMSFNKQVWEKVGGFSNNFTGWGLEDAYFGANSIAKGCFLVPLTLVGVYHINHPPRSGSEAKKSKEYSKNLEIYNKLMDREIYD